MLSYINVLFRKITKKISYMKFKIIKGSDSIKTSDEILKEIGYVLVSNYRTEVMKSLSENAKIPSTIAKEAGIRTNHISNTLKQLKDHELVECINPEVRKGRIYRLTEKGEDVINSDGFK